MWSYNTRVPDLYKLRKWLMILIWYVDFIGKYYCAIHNACWVVILKLKCVGVFIHYTLLLLGNTNRYTNILSFFNWLKAYDFLAKNRCIKNVIIISQEVVYVD